ncbi:chromate efflux transporter [Ferviditalea candida]|uniref:Chromate efflux transporter n=1 Tax=Ferviditalea candida TaxID=3108399 RepID=A0ABU5ZDW9_9BACL|nr:chromate efflux transporter [Paenibacillaceae bacterium T2]
MDDFQDLQHQQSSENPGSAAEVLKVSTRLGLTSFGGPVAHLGYFHEEYVKRRKWIDEKSYADLVALCQFLPGPASSQLGIAVGIERAGILGGIAAWAGFTLPSAIALVIFAFVLQRFDVHNAGWLHGLMIVAVAVVAQAVWSMARTLAPDRTRGTLAILTAIICLLLPSAFTQIVGIAGAGVFGHIFLGGQQQSQQAASLRVLIKRQTAITAWVVFIVLLLGLPLLRILIPSQTLAVFESFYRAGSLVFGGGHVVLPLLQNEVVPNGWLSNSEFLAGYGAAQAVPGPLFTFAAYLGAVMHPSPNGWIGAGLALLAIFLPAFLLVLGSLPFWNAIRGRAGFQAALRGINAAVLGILGAALYDPVWISAIHTLQEFSLALAAFGMLLLWKLPPWLVVVFGVIGGYLMNGI